MTTTRLGPEHGTLTLHTGVEGRAAKAGHALTIAMPTWSAEVDVENGTPTSVTVRIPLGSLEVVAGDGGLKPLSDKDRTSIKKSALETLAADKHPEVVFTSRTVTPREGGYVVAGDLAVAGRTHPSNMEVTLNGTEVVGTVSIVQSEHGVKPYTGLMGGLRVRDRVDVRLIATLPL